MTEVDEKTKQENSEDEQMIRDSVRSVLEKHQSSSNTNLKRPLVDDPTAIEAAKVLLRLVQGRGKPKNQDIGGNL